jgi:hypothetical protein
MFMRSTKLSATTKLSSGDETPPIANVLLSDALLSGYVCFDVIFVFCMLFCVDKKIKKEGRKKILLGS